MLSAVMFALLLQMRFQSPSCIAGEGWEFLVRGTDVDKSPRWSETSDAPPLTPRAAVLHGRCWAEWGAEKRKTGNLRP